MRIERIALACMLGCAVLFGAGKDDFKQFNETFAMLGFNSCAKVQNTKLPRFKSFQEINAYFKKKGKQYEQNFFVKYNMAGCLQAYGDLFVLLGTDSLAGCAVGYATLGALGGANKKQVMKKTEACMIATAKQIDAALYIPLQQSKPFKKPQTNKQKEGEAQEPSAQELAKQAEQEARKRGVKLAALGAYLWSNEYEKLAPQPNKEAFQADLESCMQAHQGIMEQENYFIHKDDEVELDSQIAQEQAYKELAYCVMKEPYAEAEKAAREQAAQGFTYAIPLPEAKLKDKMDTLSRLAFLTSWDVMAEKNKASNYDEVTHAWFHDEAKLKEISTQAESSLEPLQAYAQKLDEKLNPQYAQCDEEFFFDKKKKACREKIYSEARAALESEIETMAQTFQPQHKE